MQTWKVVDGLWAKRYQIIPVAVQKHESGAGANGKSVRLFSFCSMERNKPLKDDRSFLILTSRVHESDWPTEGTFCRLTHLSPHRSSTLPLSSPFNLAFHLSRFTNSATGRLTGHAALPFFLSPCAPRSLCEQNSPAVLFLEEGFSF